MSHTVSQDKTDDEYREYLDSPEEQQRKISQLADLVRKHRGNVVVYTGAGISTGAGIPDFRSGLGSVTGMPAGKWCQNATETQWSSNENAEEEKRRARTTSCLQAIPTKSHMALVQLHREGVLKGLISQNCDGLHRRSGFNPDHLAELHGNTNLEYCGWCGKEYMRDFRASTGRRTRGVLLKKQLWKQHSKLDLLNPRKGNHYTGRRCQSPGCEGYLFDSTIDFGDNLPEVHISRGFELAEQAGLCIVLGSRCSVSPACNMPISVGESGRDLVVVNLQKTSADPHAALRIGATIDQVMVPLMRELGVPIPEFELVRRVAVKRAGGELTVRGVDRDETPNDLLWNVQVRYGEAELSAEPMARVEFNQDALSAKASLPAPGDTGELTGWPWATEDSRAQVRTRKGAFVVSPDICNIVDETRVDPGTGATVVNAGSRRGAALEHVAPDRSPEECSGVTLMFRAHYREPPVTLPAPGDQSETLYELVYSPMEGQWREPNVLLHESYGCPEPEQPAPAVPEEDPRALFLDVQYQDKSEAGKYRCFHQICVAGDQASVDKVAEVKYRVPGQGFRCDEHSKTEPPFVMNFGPCWGRPHVTVDVVMKDGQVLQEVFSENLPAADEVIALALESA